MQGVPAAHLQSLAAALQSTLAKLRREDLGLELAELEAAARLVIAEEEEEGEVATLSEVFSHASLKNRVSDDSDDDSDSSTESDSDDSSS